MVSEILKKRMNGERLSEEDAIKLLRDGGLLELGEAAGEVCRRIHPENIRTYVVDRNINYTNVCVSKCRFCAFFRDEAAPDAYLLTEEQIHNKIKEAVELGATQILMQGGLHPSLNIEWYESLVGGIKEKFDVDIHSFSPPEIVHISRVSGISVEETINRLKDVGLDSVPGGGAEILTDSARERFSPSKCSSAEWLQVMETAHGLGMKTTATMVFGMGESYSERVEHLARIRGLQDRTGGFTAFIAWTFQPENTELGGDAAGGHEYLKMLAISRIFLDNLNNIQASWVTQGPKIGQVALFFGASDMGSTMIEENVVSAAGVSHRMSERDLRNAIADAGFVPKKRNTYYRLLE